jgi:hypothetical protein
LVSIEPSAGEHPVTLDVLDQGRVEWRGGLAVKADRVWWKG